jgi:hypothetical protein
VDLELLLQRPLFGLLLPAYPSWGGLKKSELASLLKGREPTDAFESGDPDFEDWFYLLEAALREAGALDTDLVTLYF